MESNVRERKVRALRAQWEASWRQCAWLNDELKAAVNFEQRTAALRRLNQAIEENRAVHDALILLLEKEEAERDKTAAPVPGNDTCPET